MGGTAAVRPGDRVRVAAPQADAAPADQRLFTRRPQARTGGPRRQSRRL